MTLDEIRADIENRRDEMQRRHRAAEFEVSKTLRWVEMVEAELVAHDRAVAAMVADTPQAAMQLSSRPRRRDITALVRAEQERDFGQTIDQIAERISARPSQVVAALDRIAKEPAP